MKVKLCFGLALVASLLTANAQHSGKILQPWNYKAPSYDSAVFRCEEPVPFTQAALDDFICPKTGPITAVSWWGTFHVPGTAGRVPPQARRPFMIAIYEDNGNCQPAGYPNNPVFRVCVVPKVVKYAGIDCQNKRVWRLSAPLPTGPNGFVQQQGRRYWLKIAEIDFQSVRQQQPDFSWSGHRPVRNCQAVRATAAGITPLGISPCSPTGAAIRDDLSFVLHSSTVWGNVPSTPNSPLRLSFYDPAPPSQLGAPVVSHLVETDEDGNFELDPELPDGNYLVRIENPGALGLLLPAVQVAEGTNVEVNSRRPLILGDGAPDNIIDDADLTELILNFGRSGD